MKTRSVILSVVASLAVCACSLNEYPYGFYSENNFYKTEADALAATNFIYDAINYIEYSRAIVFLGDMNTDAMYPKGEATTSNKELDGWKSATFKTNTTLYNFYKYSYITINRANSVIENVGAMKDLDEDIRNQYVGEAYFMRAFSYFNLTRNFGRVPMHLGTVRKLDEATVGSAESLDEVWDRIFSDLDKAIELTGIYPVPVTGRTDRIAAYSLAAIAYLYVASAKESGVPQYADMAFDVADYYAKAVEYAGHVVDDPAQTTYGVTAARIKRIAAALASELKISGPFNIQFLAGENSLKVIECNLRASRSFPFVSKILKLNFIELATRVMLGEHPEGGHIDPFELDYVGVKSSQFSFARLGKADPVLGVDMTSTGEVACIGETLDEALLKSMLSVGHRIPKASVLVSVGDILHKAALVPACKMLKERGFTLYEDNSPSALDLIREHKVDLVINIPEESSEGGPGAGYEIRRAAVDYNVPLITNIRLADAYIRAFCKLGEEDLAIKPWDAYCVPSR